MYLIKKYKNQKKIFIIGTGRSGTHWIGNIISSNPEIKSTIEESSIFNKVTKMAVDPSTKKKIFPKLVKEYRKRMKKYYPFHYMDKSHPNIWLVDEIDNAFKNVFFIGIIRNPYATVSSMLKHKDVLKWHYNWHKYPIPNNFLGISKDISKFYEDLTITEKCVYRWISHYKKMMKLKKTSNKRILVIRYEKLLTDSNNELNNIKNFLGFKNSFIIRKTKIGSLNKWKQKITSDQKMEISKLLQKHSINY